MYADIIEQFEDIIDINNPFPSFAFKFAVEDLQKSNVNLKFLIGVPGSGKTFIISYFMSKTDKNILFLKAPVSFKELKEKFTEQEIIIIDEAQLLDIKTIEYIRTVTDNKETTVILSMHEKEAKPILELDHFKSRDIDIIKLELLSKEEIKQFINATLIKSNLNIQISNTQFNKIYKYTNGNFRWTKKLFKTIFMLLDFAHKNNLKKYDKINNCLITMAALKTGLEND